MINLTEFKKVALDAVLKAEERILYYFHNQPKIEAKVDKTPVTKADKEYALGGTSLATNGLVHEEMLAIIKTS